MRKKITAALLITMIALFLAPAGAWARVEILPDTNPEIVDVLEFKDIPSLVYNRNDMFIASENSLYVPGGGSGAVFTDLIAQLQAAMAGYVAPRPDGSIGFNDAVWAAQGPAVYKVAYDVYTLLNTQIATVQMQAASLSATMNSVSGQLDSASLSVEKAGDSLVSAMEGLYISYNSLREQRLALETKRALLEKSLAIARLQQNLGMNITIDVTRAEIGLREMDNGLTQLKNSEEALVRQINVNIGQDAGHALRVGSVPVINSEAVSAIDWAADTEKYSDRSYDVRSALQADDDHGIAYARAGYKENMRSLYMTLIDKQRALAVASASQTAAGQQFAFAALKYELGMMSEVQYLSEKSAFQDADAAYKTAYNDFYQAYNNYEWGTFGLTASSGGAG
ncbi:MAG: hypothetical protein LBQ16_02080 [Gracilibacteraceae bacterium]|jgi:outer membrane protein TolC|nr:hypothetical protein [Gracilibacteraceae bacterium]